MKIRTQYARIIDGGIPDVLIDHIHDMPPNGSVEALEYKLQRLTEVVGRMLEQMPVPQALKAINEYGYYLEPEGH